MKSVHQYLLIPIILITFCFFGCKTKRSFVTDFTQPGNYPPSSSVTDNKHWISDDKGTVIMCTEKGLLFPADATAAWSAIRYARGLEVKDTGDAVTVLINFTYDQTAIKNEKEALRVGLGNGQSRLMATFNRKGWGDYHAIGREGYPVGRVFHTNKIGFENNTSTGTSDPLQLAMTLTRREANRWDMVVILRNLRTDFTKRWEQHGLVFPKGQSNTLYGMIQNGESDAAAGVANRWITRFELSNKPAPTAPPKNWNGVDFKDYFLPMEPQGPLATEGVWGTPALLPRDPNNGLEDKTLQNWCYWDGSIVRDDAGKYHLYASRWDQRQPHGNGWKIHSKAVHAVSDKVMGPYRDQGLTWPHWKGGAGHNVIGLRTFDGRYAAVTSERTRGEVFVADTPDGPWKLLGEIKVDYNGFNPGLAAYQGGKGNMSNVMIIPRHDGRYMIVARSTAIMISEDGILGPYKIMSDRVYEGHPELPQSRMEDPTAWYSGGMYHMLVNHWPGNTTYHFSSKDGIHNWKYRGIAYRKDESLFHYTDGTVDEWRVVQRPTAYTEDGRITHFNFSVIDVSKGEDKGGDEHGSKIIVVPFDGAAFDRDMQRVVAAEE